MNENPSRSSGSGEGFRPYAGVLAECRDLVRGRLSHTLMRASQAMEGELQERRQGTGARDESLFLLEALYQVRGLVKTVGDRFSTEFDQCYIKRTRPQEKKSRVYEAASGFFPELALVDDEQISDNLAVRNLSARLQKNCDEELQPLQIRVALMVGAEEIDVDANPVGPTVISEALKDMCSRLDGSLETRSLLLDMYVTQVADALAGIYKDANALLVSRKVLPEARPRVKRRAVSSRLEARRQEAGVGGAGKVDPADIIQRLFSEQDAGSLQPDWATRTGGAGLIQMFTQLQRGGTGAMFCGEEFSIPADAAGGPSNVINALLDAGLGKHLGSVDGIVIDVVATLFDYIFDDDRVPDPIKGLIGRLQIPVLKLAMMDHSFFSNRAHPARRLINALAQAGITWDGEVTQDSTLYRKAEAMVLRIQDEFAEDAKVFGACQQEFDAYLAEQERHADERAAALTERLKQREREELARSVAKDAVSVHLTNEEIPELLRTFLARAWVKVLTRASIQDEGDGKRWGDAVAVMEELVWSVLPKYDAEARQRLVKGLPSLLKGVRAGMEDAELDEAAQKAFLSELVKCHSAALKASMVTPEVAAGKAASIERVILNRPEPPAPEDAATLESERVDSLVRGNWIELKDEAGEIRRVRLTWVSPARTMYLFANRQGQRALALTRSELIRRFEAGEAQMADEELLLDRVVDDVLDGFHGKN